MCQLSNEDWLMNIENTAAEVEKKYGAEAVEFVFKKYGVNCSEDLNPSDYSEVFGELYQMSVD